MVKRNDDEDEGSVSDGFEALMNRTYNDIPDEVTLPNGTYRLKARNAAVMAPRDEGQNGKFVIFFIPKEPMDDVDPDDLPDDITAAEVSATVWLERPRDWKKAFDILAKLGVDVEGKSLPEAAKAARGKEIFAAVSTRVYQSQGQSRSSLEAKDFASVEE